MTTTISTGFQTEDLFGDESMAGYDVDATAEAYAAQLREALEAAFPGAEITINRRDGVQGSLSWETRTRVYDDALAAGDDRPSRTIAEQVDQIAGDVYDSQTWVREAA